MKAFEGTFASTRARAGCVSSRAGIEITRNAPKGEIYAWPDLTTEPPLTSIGAAMRWTSLGTLPYFLAGVAVGIFVDRILGGPAGESGLATIVSAVAAAFALSGPFLQEKYRQSHDDEILLRQEKKDHVLEIADTTLSPLGGTVFRPDTLTWRPDEAPELEGIQVPISPHGTRPIENLQYWPSALEHMAADPAVGPAWKSLVEGVRKRRAVKSEFDKLTAAALAEAVAKRLGPGFVRGRGSQLPPPAPCFYDPTAILGHLRTAVDVGSFSIHVNQNFGTGPEGPTGRRTIITYGPDILAVSTDPDALDLDRFREMYVGLRNDPVFRIRLTELLDLDASVSQQVSEFDAAAYAYFERVRGSRTILGKCPLCPRLEDK